MLIILIGCGPSNSNSGEDRYTYIHGKIIENIGDSILRINGVEIDSISNHIHSKGEFLKDLKNNRFIRRGWHEFYDSDNLMNQKIEYLITVENNLLQENPSQVINFDSYNDTLFGTSTFYNLSVNFDSVAEVNDTLAFLIKINTASDSMKVHGDFRLIIKNSFERERWEINSSEPYLKYYYIPKKNGKLTIEGYILFYSNYGHKEDVDSVIPISMIFEKEIQIE